MKWSKDPPTEPGDYRFRELPCCPRYAEEIERVTGIVIDVPRYDHMERIRQIDIDRQEFLHYAVVYRFSDVEWCPIPQPEEEV